MGFSREKAVEALEKHNYNLSEVCFFLMDVAEFRRRIIYLNIRYLDSIVLTSK